MKSRVFLAINLPKKIREEIGGFKEKLKDDLPKKGVKMVETENLHITLHFLGDQKEGKIGEISKKSEEVAKKCSAFEIAIDKLHAFPNKKFPRIVVLEEKGSAGLQKLRNELGEKLEDVNIEIDKRLWKGHITLARIKFGKIDFEKILQKVGEWQWKVGEFDLVKSELTDEGPKYKIIKSFKLM